MRACARASEPRAAASEEREAKRAWDVHSARAMPENLTLTCALPRLALPCLALPCLALPCLALPCLVFAILPAPQPAFEAAVAAFPQDAEALANLALLNQHLGRVEVRDLLWIVANWPRRERPPARLSLAIPPRAHTCPLRALATTWGRLL